MKGFVIKNVSNDENVNIIYDDIMGLTIKGRTVSPKLFSELCEVLNKVKEIEVIRGKKFKLVAYKTIRDNYFYFNNAEYEAIIDGRKATGVICTRKNADAFFCSNICDGATAPNKFGYRYSWCYDSNVDNIKVKSINNDQLKKFTEKVTPIISNIEERLMKLLGYKVTITKEHVGVGCNGYLVDDLLKIYNEINGDSIIIRDLNQRLDNIMSEAEEIKNKLKELKVTKDNTKTESSLPLRDSNGRFIKKK